MNRGPRLTLLLVMSLATLAGGTACGTRRPGVDADADSSAMEVGDGMVTVGPCDPALQNCPAGMKCDFFCDGNMSVIGCRADNVAGAAVGAACDGTTLCKKGGGCFATGTSVATCRQYCMSDDDCAAGRCQEATISVSCGPAASRPLTMKICF